MAAMDCRLPLPALLSQALVAFTIEFDNEFEHRTPHRTSNHDGSDSKADPWLVSMAMWLHFLQFIPPDGISARELKQILGLPTPELRRWLTRLSKWWGYLVVEPGSWIVRPTAGGLKAIETWRPLTGIIEKRWEQRFGKELIEQLRLSMQTLTEKLGSDLPDYLPILGYDLLSRPPKGERQTKTARTLPALLSKALLAYAIEFERESGMSLAICANVLRVAGPDGVRVRDLPRLSGVSKEAIAMAAGRLEERGLATVSPESPGSRVKTLVLSAEGMDAQRTYGTLVWSIEKRWESRFGKSAVAALRDLLERLVYGDGDAKSPPLLLGLESYPDGWRASLPRPQVLPHYPMVLHRGGYPDGS
jgi:DNA-binding MarR family transcriptional regulator